MARSIQINKVALFHDLGYEPHPGQLEVHMSTAPRRTLASGVRWGKSLCAAWEAIAAALEPRERSIGWIAAPSYDLSEKVFREVVVIAAERLRHRIITLKEHEKRLVLRNLGGGISEIRGKSTDNTTSLLGEGLNWLIVDEAARMKPAVWQSHLSQRLIDKKGWALLISTPCGWGWYYDLFRRGQGDDKDYESFCFPSWTNPHLDRSLIEAERERLPERVYRQEYLAEWIGGSGQVFSGVRDVAVGEWQEARKGEVLACGIDLAKTQDFTVVIVINRKWEVVSMSRFNRIPWSAQVAKIRGVTDKYNHCRCLVDSTGVGDPIVESLRKEGVNADPYLFTSRSKTALIDNLVLLIEQKKITLPRPDLAPELLEELESYQFSLTDAGTLRSSAPHGSHDDCVMALALAAWNLKVGRKRACVVFTDTPRWLRR